MEILVSVVVCPCARIAPRLSAADPIRLDAKSGHGLVADVAFLRTDRLPSEIDHDRYGQVLPDFVAEVVDPVDPYERVVERLDLYRFA